MSAFVELVPIEAEDAEFLLRVYAGTRQEELELVPWSEAEKETFLRQQFRAQHTHYQEYFPHARFDVILVDGDPAGRLYVDRARDEIQIIDLALLPEYRGRGIGGSLMHQLLAEASAKALPVRIHVERNNWAFGWYQRLGFEVIEDKGVYYYMECPPREG